MKNVLRSQKGFTLMEMLVVVTIIGLLMAIAGAALTGTRSASVEGQVKSDGSATQTAVDNYNSKAIEAAEFPELAASGDHSYD